MKKVLFFLIPFILPYYLFGQSEIKASELLGCWKNYSEENRFFKNVTVFRPCDYQSSFHKARRFRYKMLLKSNGTCSYLTIGVTDLHKMKSGKWTFNKENNQINIFNNNGKIFKRMKINHLDNSLLLIE